MIGPFVEFIRPLGVPYHISDGLGVLGAAHLASGDHEAAETALTEAKELASTIRNPWLAGRANYYLGELARRRGDRANADDLHHEALAQRARAGLRPRRSGVAGGAGRRWPPNRRASPKPPASSAPRRPCETPWAWPAGPPTSLRTTPTSPQPGAPSATMPSSPPGPTARPSASTRPSPTPPGPGANGNAPRRVGRASPPPNSRSSSSSPRASPTPTVAERLFIGRGTVKTHLAHVFTKLGLGSRSELAAEATRRGL